MKAIFLPFISLFLIQSAYAVDKKEPAAAAGATAPTTAEPVKTPVTICTAEITYKWKRIAPPPPAADPVGAGKKGKGAYPSVSATPLDPEIYGALETPAISLTESGPIESEVKTRVEAGFPEALSRAMTMCIDLHQNQGTCLTKKLGGVVTQLDRFDFETKKIIREQSIEDCKKEHGICVSTSKSEITCRQEILPTPAPTEAPPAGKDAKKK